MCADSPTTAAFVLTSTIASQKPTHTSATGGRAEAGGGAGVTVCSRGLLHECHILYAALGAVVNGGASGGVVF
jgi:hypothetical protein